MFSQRETIEQHAHRFNQLLTELFASNRIEQLQIPLNEIITWNNGQINNEVIAFKNYPYRNIFLSCLDS